jgi:CRISPR system Cascade subunit CasD
MEFLVFQLYGPLAAWGEIAVGEHRPSAAHPSKSAIIGLLAAALGIRRNEETKQQALVEGYGLGMRLTAVGEFLRDFHTVQIPVKRKGDRFYTRRDELLADELETYPLSLRDYRLEAYAQIALWRRSHPPYTLDELAKHLQKPRFTLYLGRKSCPPALPLYPRCLVAETLKSAFDRYHKELPMLKSVKLPQESQARYYWEALTPEQTGIPLNLAYPRRDIPLSRQRWQFREREERFALETVGENSP